MTFAQVATLASVTIAAVGALLSLVSARASRASVDAIRSDVALSRASTGVQLGRMFEEDYAKQYEQISATFGPWKDPIAVDPHERRVVHDMLVSLASVHMATQAQLIDAEHSHYLSELFADWLRLPRVAHIWSEVFAVQAEPWPPGFVEYVNGLVEAQARLDSASSERSQ